jgi:tetratricopeptide (TPR) repeat protein
LYEREYYEDARALLDVALKNFRDKESLAYASVTNLSGLIALGMHQLGNAIDPFNCAMAMRRRLGLNEDDSLIAWGYNNIGMAFTEMSRFDEALANHKKAMSIRLRTDNARIGNSYSNMSSLCLRMGRVQEAETYLHKCPALKDFTD